MTDIDLNLWGELVVPLGVAICFFPALWIWICQEIKAGPAEEKERERLGH